MNRKSTSLPGTCTGPKRAFFNSKRVQYCFEVESLRLEGPGYPRTLPEMSMRRQVGVAGLQRTQKANEQFREVGNALQTQQLEQLRSQLETFKTNLEAFALKYKKDIKRDPQFRMHFQKMCNQIGVDPLACWYSWSVG